ncbi:MAG: PilZ domain-containing protein [Hylemonella sp.]|uniref:PilZ domain-containing protein n=1 Tax=Hylemonella sp. TaxID=2066020 RepID=UPI0022C3B44C|nr:PilZ domain-containing protein [Hylemonella sp.]MCZ8253969.1 PilZ domain-containing protein [Hylemonella sp.]
MFKTWKKFATRPEPNDVIDVVPVLDRSLAYRRFLRSVFQAPARLTLAGYMREVQVLDVSLKGALVDMGAVLPCPVGARGRLRLLLSSTTFIAMDVGVTRVQGSQLGLQCLHIDLDSMTHLRQLIERNSQDPALLVRELSVLVGAAA